MKLTWENVNSLIGTYSLGCSDAKATYKIPKGKVKLAIFLEDISDTATDEEINEVLSKYTLKMEGK